MKVAGGRILKFIIFLSLAGCTTFQNRPTQKQFTFEKSWARHTANGDYYLGARVNHIMEPVLYEGLVIQGNELDGIIAYDRVSGQKRWNRYINGGVTSSARLMNGLVYFGGGDGFFYALNALTGVTKWTFPIRAEGIGTPLVTESAVYFISGNNAAYALKAESGEQIWFYNRPDPADLTVRGASEPSLAGNKIYLGFSDGALVSLDKDKGGVVWEKQLGQGRFRDVDAKPVIDGDKIYISSYDGQLYCVSLSNGQTVWIHDEGGFTPVTVVDNMLYYSTSNRKVIALDKNSGKILWSRELAKTVASAPVVYRGLVIFGEWSGSLRAIDQQTGQNVAEFQTGRGVTAKPAIDGSSDSVYVMTADANLFALKLRFKNKQPEWPWE